MSQVIAPATPQGMLVPPAPKTPEVLRRFQRTDLALSRNDEVIVALDASGPGWTGRALQGRVGARPQERRAVALSLDSPAALEAYVTSLLAAGYVETPLARRAADSAGADAPLDARVEALLEWMYRAADRAISGFLSGTVAALDPQAVTRARTILAQISDLWSQQLAAPSLARNQQIVDLVGDYYREIPTRLPKRIRPSVLAADFTSNLDVHNDQLDQISGALATITAPTSGRLTALGCELTPLAPHDSDYEAVAAFLSRSSNDVRRRVRAVFRVVHPVLAARFASTIHGKSDVRLLSHGTRAANWRSILALGLIVPAAMVNGWSLGAGIYFGDMIEKSLHFVGQKPNPTDPHGILLCDVAVGHAYGTGSYSGRSAPSGYDSIFSGQRGAWAYNEYVVFRAEQQNPRFFLALD